MATRKAMYFNITHTMIVKRLENGKGLVIADEFYPNKKMSIQELDWIDSWETAEPGSQDQWETAKEKYIEYIKTL